MGTMLIQYRSFCCSVKKSCLPSLTTGANFEKPECVIGVSNNDGVGPVQTRIKRITRSATVPVTSPAKIKRRALARLAVSGLTLGTAAWSFHRSSSAGPAAMRPRRPSIRRSAAPAFSPMFELYGRSHPGTTPVLAQTRTSVSLPSGPGFDFYRSPSGLADRIYLPGFASICALPGGRAALDSLEGRSTQAFSLDRFAHSEPGELQANPFEILDGFASSRWTIIMPFVEVHDGTRLHYADWGSGKPLQSR